MTVRLAEARDTERQFLMRVSHELRTPLTAIRGQVDALVDGIFEDEAEQQLAYAAITAESLRLNRLVSDLLDLARLQAKRFGLEADEVDLNILLDQVVTGQGTEARERDIEITLQSGTLPVIIGDGDRILQIVGNLVRNAVRWTPDEGSVIVSALAEAGRVWITVDDSGTVLFGGFGNSEYGATEEHLQSDIAQLLLTTTATFGAEASVRAAVAALGPEAVLDGSGRLTKSALPARIRKSVDDPRALMTAARDEVKKQTGADQIQAETITRFTRKQVIQLVLLVALVYVAYPFISTVPAFFSELRSANWWWALLGLAVSALTYFGAAAGLWACASGMVPFRHLVIMQFANTFAATTTPAGVGGLALSTRFLQKAGLGTVRATAAVAVQQAVQVITHVALLIFFSVAAGASADLSHFVPKLTLVYLIIGVALGAVGAFLFVPKLRNWLDTAVRPKINEVGGELIELVRDPKRFAIIVLGCAGTTLGAALALWASVEAFGGGTTFVTVTVVTMVGGTLAAAAPTPGGVGAVEAALIGGLAAFGVPTAVAVPSVLLYRVLTVWLPVFVGWPIMRWLTARDMI
jgi:uncharacterized protein (TIRG00374 family)